MRLYAGTSQQFITDTIQNQIADKLDRAFFAYYRYQPSPGEKNSWRNSLRAVSQVFQYSSLLYHGVVLEYQLPMTSRRLDCLISGRDSNNNDNAVIIELKQWEKCDDAEGENEVLTWLAVIKLYQSARSPSSDSIGEAQKIVLSSLNPDHEPIVLTEGNEFSILGIFERVIETYSTN